MPTPSPSPAAAPQPILLVVVATDQEAGPILRGLRAPNAPKSQPHDPRSGDETGHALPLWTPMPLSDRVSILRCGVGKANAAGATALSLASHKPQLVLSIGLAGLLPSAGASGPRLGDLVAIRAARFGDEGVQTPGGFLPMASVGFPIVGAEVERLTPEPEALRVVTQLCAHQADVATVSTCSGTDDSAAACAAQSGAALEDMETAAVALVCARAGVPWCGVRAISNTTGDRDAQVWRVAPAFGALERVIGPLADALCRSIGPCGVCNP